MAKLSDVFRPTKPKFMYDAEYYALLADHELAASELCKVFDERIGFVHPHIIARALEMFIEKLEEKIPHD